MRSPESQAFIAAQQRTLDRFGVTAESRFVDAPVVRGNAHVLVAGEGPPVVMLNGIGTPAAMWAPLMAQLGGFTLYGVDLPGYGLTSTIADLTADYRATAVQLLVEVIEGLELAPAVIIANSLGSLWSTWLAIDSPETVRAMVHIGCPALMLGTSAPLPMRLLSVSGLSKLMMKLRPPSPRQVEQLSKMVHQHPLDPSIAELLVATERLAGFQETFLATLNRLLRLRGARPAMALTDDDLIQVTQPVQFVWGSEDPMGPPGVGERARPLLGDAEMHVVAGGHAPWLNAPEQVGSHVAPFLERH